MQQSQAEDSIKVAVRFRPNDFSTTSVVKIDETRLGALALSGERSEFTFDVAYGEKTSQSQLFEGLGRPLVDDILSGYNGTLFTYGQTGSGKTYTMYGEDSSEGLIPRISRYIFDAVSAADESVEYSIKCSMLEIYKEKLRDLLDFSTPKSLKVKESPSLGIYVDGLRSEWVVSDEELRDVIDTGVHMRVVASTYQNHKSSRSHLLCILEIEQKRANGVEKRGVFNLVDLAGSEKLRSRDPLSEKVEETKKINFSLSVLGKVIYALNTHAKHVPYRDSKLTRVLQESLGGNFKTTLIACCSSSPSYLEETLSTLKFAQRVKVIRNNARVNLKPTTAAYETVILDLQ